MKRKWPRPSRRLLVIIGLNLLLAIYSVAVGDYFHSASSSIVNNMYLVLGWVTLVGTVSYIEASVLSKLVVRGGWRGESDIRELRQSQARPWSPHHLPLTIAIIILSGCNLFFFDQLAKGAFIEGQKANYTITRLRSDDRDLQRDGILNAAKMASPRIRHALVEIVESPGENRSLAAWALGKIGTDEETPALIALLREGTEEERGAAAVALGRLESAQLALELSSRLRSEGEPLESYLYGLGLLRDRQAVVPLIELMLDEDTAPDHLVLAAWALSQLGDTRACTIFSELVSPLANPLTCVIARGYRRLRCDQNADRLIEAFETSIPEARCDAQRFIDTDDRPLQLWSSGLYRVELLDAISQIESPQARRWLEQLSRDRSQVPQIRDIAAAASRTSTNDLGPL